MTSSRAIGVSSVATVVLLWHLCAQVGLLPADVLPGPAPIAKAAATAVGEPLTWALLVDTLNSWGVGLLLTVLIAVPAGLLIGRSSVVSESTSFLVEFLKPIPPIAMIPLGLLLWGPSMQMKLVLVIFGAVWPILTQLVYGVRSIDQTMLTMARSYHLGRWQTLRRVVLPGILPFALTGLRIAASIALIVTLVAEMIGGAPGLGQAIVGAQSNNAIPRMYAFIVATGLLGLALNGALRLVERRLLHWHPSVREAVPA